VVAGVLNILAEAAEGAAAATEKSGAKRRRQIWRVFVFIFMRGVVWGGLGSDPLGGSGTGGDGGGVLAVGGEQVVG
jgi:hypothetical protein